MQFLFGRPGQDLCRLPVRKVLTVRMTFSKALTSVGHMEELACKNRFVTLIACIYMHSSGHLFLKSVLSPILCVFCTLLCQNKVPCRMYLK